jgi:predicted SAM-dependent methyltransferase
VGWTNVDFDERYNPEVVADARVLPFEDNTVDELYSSHLLEHFGYEEPLLEEWCRVLCCGGKITIVVPDLIGTWYAWKAGFSWGSPERFPIDLAYMNAVAYGAHILSPEFIEINHTHKQIFIMDMLVERMRPLFPDAVQLGKIQLPGLEREAFPGETMVRGTKPGKTGLRFKLEGKGVKH